MGGHALIVLDTHALLWLDQAIEEMGLTARADAQAALSRGELGISAISFWEVGMLVSKQRVTLRLPLREWRSEIERARIREIPVDGEIAIRAAELRDLHGDPADRLVVATAIAHDATLLTADRRLLSWSGDLARQDARL